LVTESWITDSINIHNFHWQNFSFFSQSRRNRKGGGVCIWCKNIYNPLLLTNDSSKFADDIDTLALAVTVKNLKIIIVLLYIPPQYNHSDDIDLQLCEWLNNEITIISYDGLIVCGDTNRVNLNILQGEYNLKNIVTEPTRNNAILDKIFVNESLLPSYSTVNILDPIASSDHNAIFVKGSVPECSNNKNTKLSLVYDFRNSFLPHIDNHFAAFPKFDASNLANVNIIAENFYNIAYQTLNELPAKVIKRTITDKPWINNKIKSLINDRWKAYRNKNFAKYEHLKEKVKLAICSAKKNWISSETKGKNLWSIVRKIEGKKNSQSQYTIDNIEEITTQAKEIYCSNDFSNQVINFSASTTNISTNEIYLDCVKELSSINLRKSVGVDEIPNKFYRTFLPFLIDPIVHLAALSIKQSDFPNSLKMAYIIPIPKKSASDVTNFRPISVLNTIARVVEKIIFKFYEAKIYNAYGTNQFGFTSGSSTTIALIFILETINKLMKLKHISGCLIVAVDLTKAFDKVNHTILVKKLQSFTDEPFAKLIQSYLSNRKACIKIQNTVGDSFSINKGVPQGSCLGPALFCIYMSDLQPLHQSTTMVKYADDVTLILPVNENTEKILEDEIENIKIWCNNNEMVVNPSKTQALPILKKEKNFTATNIQCMDKISLLGFTLDKNLSFDEHFIKAVSKGSRNLYLLKQLRQCLQIKDLQYVFQAKITSIINYGLPAIPNVSFSAKQKIAKLYKRCFMIMQSGQTEENSTQETQKKQTLKLFQQIADNKAHPLHNFLPKRSHTGRYLLPKIQSQFSHNSFAVQGAILFNKLFIR